MRKKSAKKSERRRTGFLSIPRPIYLALVLVFAFGMSAFARAAQKVKRIVKETRDTIKASYEALLSARAWSYFHPVWQGGLPGSDFQQSPSNQDLILGDPDNKIEREFRVPRSLKGRVSFWVDVYARFNSSYRIVHDRDNPEIIYGYMDFTDLYTTYPRNMATAKAYQIEKRILKELKARLAESFMTETGHASELSTEEKVAVRSLLSKANVSNPEQLQKLLGHIRTQTGQRDFFLKALERSRKYLPQIEKMFQEKGLPVALARLPFVESSFNPSANSKDGAFGMWQLMPDTAKLFDRSGTKRELAEPIRQSKSALKMLKLLKTRLPNWGVAVTAYNSGAARLDRIVKKHRVRDIVDLVEVPSSKETLGFAGKNFYCELLAANLVEAYQESFFPPSAIKISGMVVSRKVQSLLDAISIKESVPTRDPSSKVDGVKAKTKMSSPKLRSKKARTAFQRKASGKPARRTARRPLRNQSRKA